MRTTGSTVISRDSIVWPSMEGGPKREIKEGPCPRRLQAKRWSVYEDRAAEPQLDAEGEQTNAKRVLFPT